VDARHKAGHDDRGCRATVMTLAALFFYLFAGVCVASAFMVIAAKNPVHSVLFLILAFVNASGLFVLLGAEFIAMILVVVYVGAVAVLFLFVVMMLDVDFTELREGFLQYLPIGAVVGCIFLAELVLVVGAWAFAPTVPQSITAPIPNEVSNTMALGLVLYTRYVYYFQIAGLVLLVAMIGAIVLTLHHRREVKRQDVRVQSARTKATAIEIKKVRPGQGIEEKVS
jgi:NADH-quinone oxidoreductase subunit J